MEQVGNVDSISQPMTFSLKGMKTRSGLTSESDVQQVQETQQKVLRCAMISCAFRGDVSAWLMLIKDAFYTSPFSLFSSFTAERTGSGHKRKFCH